MEGQQGQDRGSPASLSTLPLHDGDGPLPDNQTDQPRSPKDERIASPNPSVNAAVAGSGRLVSNQSETRNASRAPTPVHTSTTYTTPEQTYFYGDCAFEQDILGYDDGSVNWGENSNYVHPNNLQMMPPAIYNENGSGYYLHYPGNNGLGFYQFSGDGSSSEPVSSQSTPVGILGPYEHSFGQQQTPYHGYELSGSTTRRYPQSGSYEASRLNHHGHDKEVKQRDRDSISLTGESHATTSDRNRGPRASKPKGSSSVDPMSNNHASRSHLDLYNRPDFVTTYEKAKFFVIKSFSEDNVHRSIKYGVWASTPLGNRKLDAAYQEAQEAGGSYPIFLFFSVNASGQFCGVAEMVGPVDFENDAEYWQQDRWSGQFRVQWHIIKDVPNSRFRHILLENNDNKPVTHSRDSQEVKLEEGIAMLKIFKEHDSETSILDDFHFYDEREKCLQEKKVKMEQAKNNVDDGSSSSINELSDRVAESLQLEKQ
ncbi:YTH domain-containing protein 2-like isoform X5 [Cynara cardunculus var. scolymus]|uniref:YTH domain-containing protein 2-like isoform X5 n=1 Tax=Cynara cardunculus var. scolymus TaxID=59895 RepID=UPI000D62CD8C|nr:YTH domain-containing protein 2-like isoform X5 [Cynara cardunculus var. scolymus]